MEKQEVERRKQDDYDDDPFKLKTSIAKTDGVKK